MAFGHLPRTELVAGQLELDEQGCIVVDAPHHRHQPARGVRLPGGCSTYLGGTCDVPAPGGEDRGCCVLAVTQEPADTCCSGPQPVTIGAEPVRERRSGRLGTMEHQVDVAIIGAGQAGLAVGWYLRRRTDFSFVILDDQDAPGGAWRHTWPSLRLFSPSSFSSLPGRLMPTTGADNPDAAHVIDYLTDYETRYDLPVHRPVRVNAVHRDGDGFRLQTTGDTWSARAVVSATGTWSQPFWPALPGRRAFRGSQVHSARYAGPDLYQDQRMVVVGGANSAAQIAADLAETSHVTWCLKRAPQYLPDGIDGSDLFRIATQRAQALAAGQPDPGGVAALGNIVVVPPVERARDAGLLDPTPMFERFTPTGVAWADGREQEADAVIWCTGFRPALRHLRPLQVREDDGPIRTDGTASTTVPGLYLVGYGDWTGPGSATLIGVGPTAKATAAAIKRQLTVATPAPAR